MLKICEGVDDAERQAVDLHKIVVEQNEDKN
jgi:hypothetical protein